MTLKVLHIPTINVQHIKANIWYHGSSTGADIILLGEGIPNATNHYDIRVEYTATACCPKTAAARPHRHTRGVDNDPTDAATQEAPKRTEN